MSPDYEKLEYALAPYGFDYTGSAVVVHTDEGLPPGVVDDVRAAGYELHAVHPRDGWTDVVFRESAGSFGMGAEL